MKQFKHFLILAVLAIFGFGQMWGAKITYTFNSKSWGATVGSTAANWTSGQDGGQLTANQGIQVTTTYSGANGTSPVSFTAISKIEVQYCTNASKGVGTIKVQVGSNTEKTFSVTKPSSGGTTLKTATFTYTTTETGSVKVTAECTTNSVYIYSVTIYYQTAVTLKKNDGASDGSVKINHDATSYVTSTFNEVTRDGYNCTGYYTASSAGTKVLNANGTFAGANVSISTTNYITSSKWAYEGATLDLYAQWESAGCTNNINIIKGSESHGTFTLDKDGSQATCSGLSVVVTPDAADHYHIGSVSASTGQTGNDNGDGTWTITYAADVTGESTINVVFAEDNKYTLNYHDGSGDGSKTNVYEGTNLITALGNPAASCDATSKTFMGWSTTEIVTKTNTPPTFVAANAVVNSTTAAATYYAVYAKKGDLSSVKGGDIASSFGETGLSGSHSEFYSGSGFKFKAANNYVTTGDISSNNYKDVTVKLKAGHNGGSGSVLTIASLDKDGNTIDSKTLTPSEAYGSQSTTYTFELSGSKVIKEVRVTMTSKTNNLGMKYCEVFYAPLSDYMTTCCTELGTISGAVTLTQLTSGDDKGKLQATWSMASKTGLADNGIKINIYKVGTATAVHTSAALSKDATSYTWATAPDKCTEYYATLTTIKANNTYCEGEEQGQSENIKTAGYTITYNLTDDHVTKKSGDAPTSSCSGDVGAYYEAVSGYVLPDDITVTNAGTKGTDWLWDSSDGSLIIDASKITGDVAVTITATVAPCDPMSNPSVTVEKTYNGATLSWSAISHAAKYKVYIYNNDDSDLESNENVTGTSYTVSSTLTGLTTYKYRVDAVSENESSYCSSYTTGSFTTPDYPTVKLFYSENGELSEGVDKKILTDITLPTEAAECDKQLVGWTTAANASYSHASTAPDPLYAPGKTDFQIPTNANCTLYAVYANVVEGALTYDLASSISDGDVVVISTNPGYTAQDMKTAGTVSSDVLGTTSSTYNTDKSKITELATGTAEFTINGNNTDGWTVKIGSKYLAMKADNKNKVALVDDAYTWSIAIENNIATILRTDHSYKDNSQTKSGDFYIQYNYNQGSDRFSGYQSTFTGGVGISLYKKNEIAASTTNYATTCAGKVIKPVISGVTDGTTYESAQTITITSATPSATIHYTTDGSEPTTSSPTYSDPFELSANGNYTIRAIAVKTDMTNSDEATPISFIIDKPYTTIASFIADAPSTAKKLVVTDAIVLGIAGNNIYIQDATAGIQLNATSHGKTWASGKKLEGTIIGTYQNNSSSAYMPRVNVTDFGTTDVTSADPALPTPVDITKGTEANICKLVRLQNVKFQSTSLSDKTVYVQKSDLDIDTVYNTFGVLDKTLPNSATLCDVTGVLIKYSGTYEIAPVSRDGITTNGAKAILPTLSPAGSTNSGSPTGVEVNEEITVTPAAGMTSTIQEDDKTPADLNSATEVTIDADKSITVTASAYYYDNNSATYYYHPDPSLTKYAIGKSAMTNGGVTVKNGDDVVTQAVSGATITLLVAPTTHYHMTGISVKDADQGTVTLTEVTAGEEYTFTMPAKAVTVSATFAEDAYATVAFAKGNESATGSAPSSISKRYVGQTATMPANTFALAAHDFAGWKYRENTYNTGASYTILAEDAAIGGKTITFDAQWTPWPDEATIYSSNISTTNADSKVIPEDEEEYDAWKIAKGSNITLTIPAGTTTIYGHLVAWNKESANVTISGSCFSSSKVLTPAADGGIANSSPFTLEEVGSTYYFKLTPDVAITENVNITFTTASDKRAVVFGVNAIYPKITLDPEEYAFGNVRANQTKSQEFTITANENVSGALSASITNDASGKFSVGSISAGKVTVTFDPDGATSGDFTAKLKISASNASVTADLSGTAIAAEAPEITVDKNAVAFGQVDPNAEVSESIAVELLHIDGAVSAALSGTNAAKFGLSPTSLSANGNIVVTPNTSEIGIFSATLTLSATGADDVVIPLSITVANKWAVKYTSNVTVTAQENKKVKVGSSTTEYNAHKKGNSTNPEHKATIHLPMGTQKLHLHMVAWKSEGGDVTLSGDCFNDDITINVPANDVVSGTTGTYTFADNLALSYYHEIAIDNAIASGGKDVTVAYSGKRIILFGVNQEGGTYEVTENQNVSTLPDDADVILKDGATLTINEPKQLGSLTAKEGTKVAVNNPMTVQTFSICATVGGTGSSGEADIQAAVTADEIHADIRLAADDNNTFQNQWHSFTVPFPVDAMNGIYDTLDNKLGNEVNYAIMDYHGDVRATGGYGWKKYRGVLVPGTFYLITVDANTRVLRMKKTATGAVKAGNSIAMKYWGDGDNTNTNNGWCGVGNQNWFGGYVPYAVQVLNSAGTGYEILSANSAKFSACIPFFIQIASDATLTVSADLPSPVAARRAAAKRVEDIKITFGNDEYKDRLYISASEDAKNEYEIGKDLVKMTMTSTPKVAQIFGKAYNAKLCMVYAPMSNDQAVYDLSLYAPANGEYVMSAPETEDADVYLTKDGMITWNLSMSECTLELNKGNNEGYGLLLVKKAPSVATGVENTDVQSTDVQKVVIDNHVFILRGGKMYGVDGKKFK